MTRLVTDRSGELIEVRHRDSVPEQFLWRGRLYLVQEVLAQWTESGQWWRADPTASGPAAGTGSPEDAEQQWWRVEAASGRSESSAGSGVYDLCFAWATGTWSLRRVQD